MPCLYCGARQTDPARGASPWARAVAAGAAVLVCPDCQRDPAWTARLDRCPGCGGTRLGRRLGETGCRDCGWSSGRPPPAEAPRPEPAAAPGLAEEVAAAVERVLGARPGGPYPGPAGR